MSAKKGLLGFLSAWPLIYIVGFIGFVATGPLWMGAGHGPPTTQFAVLFALHGITMLEILGLTVYYVVDALRDEPMEQSHRFFWALTLFVGNALAFPIYWAMVVQPRDAWGADSLRFR